MKTKGTFPGSFSVVDYKITSEYIQNEAPRAAYLHAK